MGAFATDRAAVLASLRAKIHEIEGGSPVERLRAPSGIQTIDALTGGLPVPGLVELSGLPGSGSARLALSLAAAITASGQAVAWVDPLGRLYPPTAFRLGLDPSRLLVVRPPADGQRAELWTTEQLLRSGCFALVVVDLPPGTPLRSTGHGWSRAAEHGRCTGLAVVDRPARWLPAEVRLSIRDGVATLVRDRGGRLGATARLPPWPPLADPWG